MIFIFLTYYVLLGALKIQEERRSTYVIHQIKMLTYEYLMCKCTGKQPHNSFVGKFTQVSEN
jgi:hypothetical protein